MTGGVRYEGQEREKEISFLSRRMHEAARKFQGERAYGRRQAEEEGYDVFHIDWHL